MLTHLGAIQICIIKLCHHWFGHWLVAYTALTASYYIRQCCHVYRCIPAIPVISKCKWWLFHKGWGALKLSRHKPDSKKTLKLKVKDDVKDISKPYKVRPAKPRSNNSRPQRLPQGNGLTAWAAEDTSRPAHTNGWTRVNGQNRRHWHAQGSERNSGNEQFRQNQRPKLKWMTFNTNDSPLLTHKVFLVISVVRETTKWILAAGDIQWSVICGKKRVTKRNIAPNMIVYLSITIIRLLAMMRAPI